MCTELYEALVDRDGCMPSLRIDGVEILKSGINVSRGVYFLPGYPLPFDIKQPAPTTVTAQCDKAAIQYDFAPNKITWTVENRSDQGMPFFVVMDTSVTAVQNEKGEWSKLPVNKNATVPAEEAWKTTTWYAGRAKLKMTGGSKVWGPWEGSYQVWEASMAPKEKRVITVEIGLTDASEAEKLGDTTGFKPTLATDLTLDAPMDYQVFQRKTKLQGAMTVRGRVRTAYDRLEVRTTGKPLQGQVPDQVARTPDGREGAGVRGLRPDARRRVVQGGSSRTEGWKGGWPDDRRSRRDRRGVHRGRTVQFHQLWAGTASPDLRDGLLVQWHGLATGR